MIGRQVIEVNRPFTLDELLEFMNENWDTETHCKFTKGRPTAASIEEYILLPATGRFMVAAYARKAGGFLSKENKVILTVCDTPEGIKSHFATSIPSDSIIFGAVKISMVKNREKERKGPAEDILQIYAKYMRELLDEAGYLK